MDGKLRNMASIYLLKNQRILLLYRQGGKVVNNLWTGSAGGHFENCELNDARACVLRELEEELGLQFGDIENLALRYITLKRTNGEIRQNYYFFATLKEMVNENLHSNEGICRWFSLDDIHSLEMPLTAKFVLEHFCQTGHATDKLYAGVATTDHVFFSDLPDT